MTPGSRTSRSRSPPSVATASATPSPARSRTTSQARPATSRPAAASQLAPVWFGERARKTAPFLVPASSPLWGCGQEASEVDLSGATAVLAEGAKNDQQSVAATEEGRQRLYPDRAPRRDHHPRDPACDCDPLVPQLPHAAEQVRRARERPRCSPGHGG